VRSLPAPREAQGPAELLLAAAGRLWLAGVDLDWQGLHAGERRRRVELPTYPFEHKRYWVERRPPAPLADTARPNVRKEISDWFYVPAWTPAVTPDEPAGGEPHRWLLLGAEGGIGEAMARRLAERGDAVALAMGGEEGYAELFARLRTTWGAPPDRVVYIAGRAAGGDGEAVGGFLSLLGLAQELGRQPTPSGVELRVVTTGLQAVGRGETLTSPGQAVLLGPVRTLPLEHPGIGCAAIDVEPGEDPDRLAGRLIAEAAAPAADAVIALRRDERWVERFSPVRLNSADGLRPPWRERGVYLITGGLGGLGLTLAEELARSFRARLALTGRTGLPPREQWPAWLAAQGEDNAASRRIRGVSRLEALGAEVLVVAADVTDEGAMRRAVRLARERFGPVQGAIHAAGVPGGGVIQLKTAEAAERVLAPKLQGTRALAAALADEPLDLLVLCSSTFAVTGGVGQVDYCAANGFLDAFARHHSARGVRTVSIGWGAWQEVGMAAEAAAIRGARPKPAGPAAPLMLANPPLLDRRENGPDGVAWLGELSPSRHWLLAEHRVAGTPTLPGTTYLEMARAAWSEETGSQGVEISGVTFVSPLLVPGGNREVRIVLPSGAASAETSFRVESRAGGVWQEHAHGRLAPLAVSLERRDVAAIAARCTLADQTGGWDAFTSGSTLVSWGPRWQSLRRARVGTDEALLDVELPPELAADLDAFGLHPALLDLATAFGGGMSSGGPMLPASYGRVRYAAPLPGSFLAHLHTPRHSEGDEELSLDLALMAPSGEVLVEIEGFTLRRLARRSEPAAEAPPARAATGGSADWILPAEGVEAFRRVLSRGRFPHVVVSPLGLDRMIAALRERAVERSAAEGPDRQASARPALANEYVPAATETETTLIRVWKGVLGLDEVGSRDNFFDLGGDSVIAIQLVARAAVQGLQFSPDHLFEHQTIAELARWLDATAVAPLAPIAPLASGVGTAGGAPAAVELVADDLSTADLDKIFSQLKELP
jgi:NAD(P)-dependent dehydrogenase (short-subunit alcohol dehydrogenase family)